MRSCVAGGARNGCRWLFHGLACKLGVEGLSPLALRCVGLLYEKRSVPGRFVCVRRVDLKTHRCTVCNRLRFSRTWETWLFFHDVAAVLSLGGQSLTLPRAIYDVAARRSVRVTCTACVWRHDVMVWAEGVVKFVTPCMICMIICMQLHCQNCKAGENTAPPDRCARDWTCVHLYDVVYYCVGVESVEISCKTCLVLRERRNTSKLRPGLLSSQSSFLQISKSSGWWGFVCPELSRLCRPIAGETGPRVERREAVPLSFHLVVKEAEFRVIFSLGQFAWTALRHEFGTNWRRSSGIAPFRELQPGLLVSFHVCVCVCLAEFIFLVWASQGLLKQLTLPYQ